jgi:hypothetical protein
MKERIKKNWITSTIGVIFGGALVVWGVLKNDPKCVTEGVAIISLGLASKDAAKED